MNIEEVRGNLEKRGFETSCFETGGEAADYIVGKLSGETIGIGGSCTVDQLGLYDRLKEQNTVYWHWKDKTAQAKGTAADVYICSANAIAETGEIVNIDGTGNRIAATIYGKKKVYIIVGVNKIAKNIDKALWRARNIASPLNARRLNLNTPCVKGELMCYDCSSTERICKGILIFERKMGGVKECEVVIVNEDLGY